MKGRYRIQAFAVHAGVTVKALLYYDRLGLLTPPRTSSGHRIYSDGDGERLDQIVALKFLGLPLKQIRAVLDGQTLPLCQALRAQREALAVDRDRIDRAIAVIQRVEIASAEGHRSDAALLRQLTDFVARDADEVRQSATDAAWRVSSHLFEGLSPAWRAFYADVWEALNEDPCSDRAEALLWRMYGLINEETQFDLQLRLQVHEGFLRAWANRDRWPAALQHRVDTAEMRDIRGFLARVVQMMFLKYGPDFYRHRRHGARSVA